MTRIDDEVSQEAEPEAPYSEHPGDDANTDQTMTIAEVYGGIEAAPQADIKMYDREYLSGRKRKYFEKGIFEDPPLAQVIRFRQQLGRYPIGVSERQQQRFDYWYFSRPNKQRDKGNYAKHVKAWERREKWLASLGTNGYPAITYLPAERTARGRRAYVER